MLINVTQEHIKLGKKRQCANCPVALALVDVLPDGFRPHINHGYIHLKNHNLGIHWMFVTEPKVSGFIEAFDKGHRVEPFSFHLHLEKKVASLATSLKDMFHGETPELSC